MHDAENLTHDDRLPPEELFGILGNETRMQVLEVLWSEFDFEAYVIREQDPVTFSDIQEQTGIEDSGNLNYHLGELGDELLKNRGDGYVLTPLGYNLLRSITTYESFDYRTVDPTPLEDPCPFCGGTLEGSYEREFVHVSCQNCGGLGDGNLTFVHFPATDVQGLDIHGLLDAAALQLMARVRTSRYGVCGRCHSRVERDVDACRRHSRGAEGVCERCGGRFGADITVECQYCGGGGKGPLLEYAVVDPSIAAFFATHGRGPGAVGPWRYRLAVFDATEVSRYETAPAEVVYTFTLGDDTRSMRTEETETGIELSIVR